MLVELVKPSVEIASVTVNPAALLETGARICHKSESVGRPTLEFLRSILKKKHTGVFEHASMTVVATMSRAVSHELVRHRIASYLQESQRYVNYDSVPLLYTTALNKRASFEGVQTILEALLHKEERMSSVDQYDLTQGALFRELAETIDTAFLAANMLRHSHGGAVLEAFLSSFIAAAQTYRKLRHLSVPPEEARGVLPNDTATKVMITMNLASWRRFLSLRAFDTTGRAAPDMHVLSYGILHAVLDYPDPNLHKLLLMEQDISKRNLDDLDSTLFTADLF